MPTSVPIPTQRPAGELTPNPTADPSSTESLPPTAPSAGPTLASSDVSLGTVYYLGYGWDVSGRPWNPIGGLGSQGWNDISGDTLWAGFVTTRPQIGFYPSGDLQTIAWQLQKMEEAGIQFVLISYMGWGDADLDGIPDGYLGQRVHDATLLVLEYIKQNDVPIQFALMVEPFMEHWSGGKLEPEDVSNEQRQMILDRLWEEFYRPYSDQVYRIDGKPLIAAAERFSWSDYEDARGRYEQRNIVWHDELGASEDWSWVAASEPPSQVFEDGTVFVWPRYDEWPIWLAHAPAMESRLVEDVLRMDPFLEEGAYDGGWREIHGQGSDVDRVIVWSWNSWADKVYIEPDTNIGYASHGDLLTRKTAYYYQRLASGLPFEPMTPDETEMRLGTLMHLWYGIDPETGECLGGMGSSHWDETVLVEPEQGFYCSLDQEVIERQIQQMRRVGIDWILLSWWGAGDDQPVFRANHEATLKVLRHLQHLNELGSTMKATILVEPWLAPGSDFTPLLEISESDKKAIWTLIDDELYRPHRDIWFEWEGKPLVVAYMPMDIGQDKRFTYRRMSVAKLPAPYNYPMDWNVLDTQEAEVFANLISPDGFKKVSPRFNTEKLVPEERDQVIQMDPDLTEGWYDEQWRWMMENQARVTLPFIWTWNEYHEQNFIEPTITEPPVGSGTWLANKSRHYWHLLRDGMPYCPYGDEQCN